MNIYIKTSVGGLAVLLIAGGIAFLYGDAMRNVQAKKCEKWYSAEQVAEREDLIKIARYTCTYHRTYSDPQDCMDHQMSIINAKKPDCDAREPEYRPNVVVRIKR